MSFQEIVQNPSTESPEMAFTTGQVVNNAAVQYSSLPDIPGPESNWIVTEWDKTDYLSPSDMITDDTSLADPNYGNPLYTWQAADGLTALSVYSENENSAAGATYVYDLEESNGNLNNGGGANLFLSSGLDSSLLVTFNHPVTYSVDAKLNVASVSGGALAQVFTGFILTFNAGGNPGYDSSLPTISAFMQIGISNSGGSQTRYLVQHGNSITYTYTLPEDNRLAYEATSGGPTGLTYNLNQYLDDMIANDPDLPSAATNLALWNLDSMYIGEETENGSVADPNVGQVSVGLQVSNLQVQTDSSQTVSYENPSTFETNATFSTTGAVSPTLLTVADSSDGTTANITSDSYDGPLAFLAHDDAYSYNGSGNVTLAAVSATNPLIAASAGNDTLTGSRTGTSVLDGGTGANIETDGGNGATTFVQNGYVSGETWDFMKNFHGADEDFEFGYIPGLSKITVQDDGGTGSYTGVSVIIAPGNGNIEEATFVGMSASQIQGCSTTIDGVPSFIIWAK